jgi:hypothetical protein
VSSPNDFLLRRDLMISSFERLRGIEVSPSYVSDILDHDEFHGYPLETLVDVFNCSRALCFISESRGISKFKVDSNFLFTLLGFVVSNSPTPKLGFVGRKWIDNPRSLKKTLDDVCSRVYDFYGRDVIIKMLTGLLGVNFLGNDVVNSFLYLVLVSMLVSLEDSTVVMEESDTILDWSDYLMDNYEALVPRSYENR